MQTFHIALPVMQPLLLDLRHYETVVAIVDLETMTKAAAHLSTTQSALSHRLAEAERRLGIKLFHRGPNRRLSPTRDGLAVHQVASRALGDLGRTERHLVRTNEPRIETIRIAVGSYDCYHWFPGFLRRVRDTMATIDLDLVAVGDEPGAALRGGDVDIVIAPGRPEGALRLVELFDDELVLITDPNHHLCAADVVEAGDLAAETYLTYNSQPTPGFEYDRFFRPALEYPMVVRVVRQTSAITELVAAGVGVAILSRWALEPGLQAGRLSATRCGGDGLELTWHAATRPGDDRSEMIVGELIDHLGGRASRT